MHEVVKIIYLDNSATTMADPLVVKEMLPYFTEKYGNPSSLHALGQEAKAAITKARAVIARSINASPEEIIFTSGGTESDNLAIKGVAYGLKNKGNHIITSSIEHPAVLSTCRSLNNEGFEITYLSVNKDGSIDLNALERSITKKTILVTIMHANNEIGVLQDIQMIGEICRKHKLVFHTDAVQSYTKSAIDVKKMNLDLVSLASHKIHGPKGVGALYIKRGTPIRKMCDGGGHEFKKRAGTENVPGIVGFAKAVELALPEHARHMQQLRDRLIDGLLEIPHTQSNGSMEKRLCNNANISFNFIEGESILMMLDSEGIAVSTGSACSSHSLTPSHVLMAIGLKHEVAHGSIRFSLSRFTTEQDIEKTIEAVKKVVFQLRQMSPLAQGTE